MTRVEAERLFSLDEAIIRREAAFRWLSRPRMRDEQLLERFARETHPLVIIGIYQGIRESLRDCEPMRREHLIRLIETLVATPVGALALMDYLIIFERRYHQPSHRQKDDRADWRLFARVFPKAVAHLPAETRFDTARFENVLYEALGKIPARAVVRACAVWLDWLIRVKVSGYSPGEFVLSFVPVLMRATKQEPTLRGDLLVRALATTQTDLLLAFLSDAIDAWADLTLDERDAVLAATTAKAPDARWRRAVALTREFVPIPVEMALLPSGTGLASGAGALRMALPEPILAACLSVHCGRPYPVSIVSRADRTSVWEKIARAIATEPGAPYIGTLFDHVAHSGDVAVFCGMVREGAIARPQETFALLMAASMWRNNEHLGPGWETLLADAPNAATRDAWLDDIADAGPKIFEEWADIDGLFPCKTDAAAIQDRLENDTILLRYVGLLMQLDESNPPINPGLWHTAIRAIGVMVEKLAPVILGAVDNCIYRLRGMGTIPPEVEAQIDAARARIIDAREPIRRNYSRNETISDWVG